MKPTDRSCADCRHCLGDECRHPQAKFHWGRYLGVMIHLPEGKNYFWPKAPGWCGYFLPTDGWLVARAGATLSRNKDALLKIIGGDKRKKKEAA